MIDTSPLYDPKASKHERLVICDWLEEQGDQRANPWRWVINHARVPLCHQSGYCVWSIRSDLTISPHHLPPEVFSALVSHKGGDGPWLSDNVEAACAELIAALVDMQREGCAPWQE